MYIHRKPLALALALVAGQALADSQAIEEVRVWGDPKDSLQTGQVRPASVFTPEDLASVNVATTEDLVKQAPSLVIRRRFIGDANGTLGLRGANMFQTARSLVFADGVPLHYLLQSRWNGAPRWTLVSASEIAQIEVLYGPFSAEYSGNAMGGVVNIETAIPQGREFHADGAWLSQQFDAYGFDDAVSGYKGFLSYGDTLGDLSLYLSYNRLDNDAQPQSFYYGDQITGDQITGDQTTGDQTTAEATPVTGAIAKHDERGSPRLYFGDSGVQSNQTDNLKFKLGYDLGRWSTLFNAAYEYRHGAFSPNSYLRDAAGQAVWSGAVSQDGQAFSLPASRLAGIEDLRQSLSLGLRVKGELADSVSLEANLSRFDILRDQRRTGAHAPLDPAHTPAGEVTDYRDTGWRTADAKLRLRDLGVAGLSLTTGARLESYSLGQDLYRSDDYAAGHKTAKTGSSGGQTELAALFAQGHWAPNSRWQLDLGLRWEDWRSHGGFYADDDAATPALELAAVPGTRDRKLSPKFGLGYQPAADWTLGYSVASAYRYPIVEELFSQYQAYNSVSLANPALRPEAGLFHNLLLERAFAGGFARVNLFAEDVRDVIESQTDPHSMVRTFVPVDQVQTRGVELIVIANGALLDALDLSVNLTYTASEIVANAADPSLVGNTFTRMPEWRGNLLANYRLTEAWDLGGSIQYASDSYGRLDNTDREDGVYSAQDAFTRIGLKTSYRLDQHVKLSLGVDNLTNEIAYVAHPWPGRTLYLQASYDFK